MESSTATITLELKIPGHSSFLPVALNFIDEACKVFSLRKDDSLKIRLAAEEAIVNVIEHGLNNNIKEKFKILFLNEDDRVEVVILEKGKPFNPDDSIEFKTDGKGLGLTLMKGSADEIYFKNLGRDGKETRVVKYKSSNDFQGVSKIIKQDKKIVPIKVDFYIRPFNNEDAIEISRCAYYAYGYSYEPFIYYPAQIIRMNQNKKLISLVAVTKEGDIAGHAALKFYPNTSFAAEMGVAFVKPKYRNNGISDALADYIINMAKDVTNLKCLYVRTVTAHIFAQKTFFKRNFVPSGIFLGLFPENVEFKDITGEIISKTTGLLVSYYLKNADKKTVFLPKKHENILQEIMNDLKLDYELGSILIPEIVVDENIEYSKTDVFNTVDLYCKSYGKNSHEIIAKTVKRLLAQKVDVIYLFLDLENPYMPYVAEQCEKIGFFFSGILPFGINSHHALIYQYLNTFIDLDSIKMLDKRAEKLLEYIKPYITI